MWGLGSWDAPTFRIRPPWMCNVVPEHFNRVAVKTIVVLYAILGFNSQLPLHIVGALDEGMDEKLYSRYVN